MRKCNHNQEPADPDKIKKELAKDIARDIDNQIVERAGVKEIFNTGTEAYYKITFDFSKTFTDDKQTS